MVAPIQLFGLGRCKVCSHMCVSSAVPYFFLQDRLNINTAIGVFGRGRGKGRGNPYLTISWDNVRVGGPAARGSFPGCEEARAHPGFLALNAAGLLLRRSV